MGSEMFRGDGGEEDLRVIRGCKVLEGEERF